MGYEDLLKEADKLNVIVKEKNLKTKDGLCKGNRIAINKKLDTAKEKCCVLAEELGHYCTTVGDITNQTKINNRKQELKARRWGYEKLIGVVDIINAYNEGAKDKYDLAEYFGVTESFLDETIQHYRQKYGLCYEIDNYIIYFEPNLGVLKMF